ncbi:hypothetical protein J2T14_002711 [Paenibacillus harenae]|nr:hypothetical protein [Paenibacillus harenae]
MEEFNLVESVLKSVYSCKFRLKILGNLLNGIWVIWDSRYIGNDRTIK